MPLADVPDDNCGRRTLIKEADSLFKPAGLKDAVAVDKLDILEIGSSRTQTVEPHLSAPRRSERTGCEPYDMEAAALSDVGTPVGRSRIHIDGTISHRYKCVQACSQTRGLVATDDDDTNACHR